MFCPEKKAYGLSLLLRPVPGAIWETVPARVCLRTVWKNYVCPPNHRNSLKRE